jgi:uridine kinase
METAPQPGFLPFPPVVLGIAGCSGSGKTTLAAELARTLNGLNFPIDHYYLDLSHMGPAERAQQNFDDPALIESQMLVAQVAALARGEAIERPLYDFSAYTRVPDRTETVRPGAFVVVEGLFALIYPDLLPLYQLKIYVEAPDEICFERRLRRDLMERGRTKESVYRQYEATVRPSANTWVRLSMPILCWTGPGHRTGRWSGCLRNFASAGSGRVFLSRARSSAYGLDSLTKV